MPFLAVAEYFVPGDRNPNHLVIKYLLLTDPALLPPLISWGWLAYDRLRVG